MMRSAKLLLATLCTLGAVSACEGYELVKVESFPYGNARTAGSGVSYVLAKMPPKKGLKIEATLPPVAVERERAPEAVLMAVPVEPTKAEEIFTEATRK